MPDREKVLKGLEQCKAGGSCDECQYDINSSKCIFLLHADALALLKEQEAVEPRVSSVEQRCGNCNKVIEMDGWIACPWCGKRINWESWWGKNGNR